MGNITGQTEALNILEANNIGPGPQPLAKDRAEQGTRKNGLLRDIFFCIAAVSLGLSICLMALDASSPTQISHADSPTPPVSVEATEYFKATP